MLIWASRETDHWSPFTDSTQMGMWLSSKSYHPHAFSASTQVVKWGSREATTEINLAPEYALLYVQHSLRHE
jgi:hypothetical protein